MKGLIKENGLDSKVEIDSAGTSGYHIGELPDRRMREHGSRRGYNFDSRSRKFISDDFDDFDLIIAMDDSNYDNILRLSPDPDSENKVVRMTDFSVKYNHDHIPDPYYLGSEGFELVLNLLEDACEGLLNEIKAKL
jgi:protein-tyrosine phosphatase